MSSNTYYLNPYIFLFLDGPSLYLWDYDHHKQFSINDEYLSVIKRISRGEKVADQEDIITTLLNNNIIQDTPYKKGFWGWDKLSEIFHKGTQNLLELAESRTPTELIEDYKAFSQEYAEKTPSFENKIDMPITPLSLPNKALLKGVELVETLEKRLTSRYFKGQAIPEEYLSTLLYYAFGEIHPAWEGVEATIQMVGKRKTSPSAGGVHSIDAYVTVLNVTGVPCGLYRYDAKQHTLQQVRKEIAEAELIHIMADQFYMAGLAFGVFLVSDMQKVWQKYLHSRGYREIFLDAGHLSQTFQLLATGLKLDTWISGYLRDQKLLDLLSLDKDRYAPIFFMGAGIGERKPLHPEIIKAF
jgi:SagB-type dehydrogenase family enzyme